MNYQARISIERSQILVPGDFESLSRYGNSPFSPDFLHLAFDQVSPDAASVRHILQRNALKPWLDKSRQPFKEREYTLTVHRVYSAEDLLEFRAFHLGPPAELAEDPTPRGEGLVTVKHVWFIPPDQPDWDVVFAFRQRYFVRGRVRAVLTRAGLNEGINWGPARMVGKKDEEWWELETEHTMPPLWKGLPVSNWKGDAPPLPDFSTGFTVREPIFADLRFAYPPQAVDFLDRVGIARMHEILGGYRGRRRDDCPMVISRRILSELISHDIRVGVVPIAVASGGAIDSAEDMAIRRFWTADAP